MTGPALRLLLLGLLPPLLGGCAFIPSARSAPPDDTLFQVAPLHALLSGEYRGLMTFAQVRRHGDFGLGTLDALDGELLALDGRFYQVRGDGRVHDVPESASTPFVMVKHFVDDRLVPLAEGMNLVALQTLLDRETGTGRHPWAIRLEGRFRKVKTRSVPRQELPYPPLAEVVKQQRTFEFSDVAGSVVGFRMPDAYKGLNLPGYHFHFITADRQGGGHVLGLETGAGVLARLDRAEAYHLVPGEGGGAVRAERPGELEAIEQERTPSSYR